MSKDLVIVESPTKAKTITRILGAEYKVMASVGHIRDLPEKGLGVDIENNFEPTYQLSGQGKKIASDLGKAVKDVEHVYLAPDPDREGEAIAWHLYETLKKKNKKAQFHRVTFHEITKGAVEKSFEHPGEINMQLVDAQQARRVLDRIVGYQVSPLLWQKVVRGTSAGRVQSVVLRIVCERQEEIDNFVPVEYWILEGNFSADGTDQPFKAKLVRVDGEKAEVNDGETAGALASDAQNARYTVSDVKKVPRQRRAQPPFITSTLQQAASANLRMNPGITMRVAQQLYEGAGRDGAEAGGLITYMRTDSFNVATVAQNAARDFISQKFGNEYVPPKPNRYKSKGGAQEAHEAIRPTDISLTPEMAKQFLDRDQARLYDLIWRRFIASQMTPASYSQYTVELETVSGTSQHAYMFRATTSKLTFPGYRKVYDMKDVKEDKDDDDEIQDIPELVQNTNCHMLDMAQDQKFTEPPPLFSEAMLIRELERNGIGRPSTYESSVRLVKTRKYVANQKGKLVPTELGKTVNSYLVENLGNLFEVGFTAKMETQLDDIEEGKLEWQEMLNRFYKNFREWLSAAGARSDAPANERINEILSIFTDNPIQWAEPEKRGRRTYDDKKFIESLANQLDDGKKLSDRQWGALLTMIAKYKDQIPDFNGTVESLGISDDVKPLVKKQSQIVASEPDEAALAICELMDQITQWEEPENQRGKGDKVFYNSLKDQASRKSLSERQMGALKSMARKYADQIPSYEDKQEALGLPALVVDSTLDNRIIEMLALAEEIKTWAEPVKRGRRTYDDKQFVESISKQFKQKGALSDRQLAAFGKVLGKYAEQITDFKTRAGALGIEAAPEKKAAEETDIDCPKCGKAKLVKRSGKKGDFYGCSSFPRCRFIANTLDEIQNQS